MKKLILILSLLPCLNVSAQQKTDWEKDGLKGKVKTVKTYNSGIVNDSSVTIDTYNAQGSILSTESFENGKLWHMRRYKYETVKRITRLLITESAYSTIFDDKNKKWIEDTISNTSTFIDSMDREGKIVKETFNFSDDRTSGETIFDYGLPKKANRETTKYESGSLNIDVYDSIGRISIESFLSNGSLVYSVKYKYDSLHNLIELRSYNEDGKELWNQLNTYDENRNIVETKGMRHEKNGDEDKFGFRNLYIYDSLKNWIKKSEINANDTWVTIRTIEYYP